MNPFRLTAEAATDLTEIFDYIAGDNVDAAQRVANEIHHELEKLARSPGIGHKREDLTARDVLFWRVYSYLIVYQPTSPLNVIAVLHSRRDVKAILAEH